MMANAHANDLLSEMVNATEHSDPDGVSIAYGPIGVDGAFDGAAWTEAAWVDANGATRRFRVRIEPII